MNQVYWLLLGFSGFYSVVPIVTEFYRVFLVLFFTGFYCVVVVAQPPGNLLRPTQVLIRRNAPLGGWVGGGGFLLNAQQPMSDGLCVPIRCEWVHIVREAAAVSDATALDENKRKEQESLKKNNETLVRKMKIDERMNGNP